MTCVPARSSQRFRAVGLPASGTPFNESMDAPLPGGNDASISRRSSADVIDERTAHAVPRIRRRPRPAREMIWVDDGWRLDALTRSFDRERAAEYHRKACPMAISAGRNFQLSANLFHQLSYDFHSETFALIRIVSLRQSGAVIQYR